MTAKEYLKRIKVMDEVINQKQIEFDTLKKGRTYISGIDYSAVRVQTSPDGFGFTTMSDKLMDMQRVINEEIDNWHDMRHECINQIQQLSKVDYVRILFQMYVQYQTLEDIASNWKISYYWACHIHLSALKEFYEKFLKDSN